MKSSDFISDCVHLLYYKCHEINRNRDGSNIDSKKDKKTTLNPLNDDDKCFQCAAAVALNHEESEKKIIKKIMPL